MNQQNALLNLTTFRIYSRRIDQVVKGNEKSDWLKRERNIRMFLSLSYWAIGLRSRFWLTLKNASLNVWRKYQEWRKSKLCLKVQIQRYSRVWPIFDWFLLFGDPTTHLYRKRRTYSNNFFLYYLESTLTTQTITVFSYSFTYFLWFSSTPGLYSIWKKKLGH